jgi:hypothetical protein
MYFINNETAGRFNFLPDKCKLEICKKFELNSDFTEERV